MIQYEPSGAASRSWNRAGRPFAQPKLRATLPRGPISTQRSRSVGSGVAGRAAYRPVAKAWELSPGPVGERGDQTTRPGLSMTSPYRGAAKTTYPGDGLEP